MISFKFSSEYAKIKDYFGAILVFIAVSEIWM